MEDILGAVRCHYLSPSFLKNQMDNCDLLKKVGKFFFIYLLILVELTFLICDNFQVPACREHLYKIFQELSLHKSPCVPQRTPSAPCVLYIVAGFSRRSLSLFEAFSFGDNRWQTLEPLPKPRSGLGGAILREQSNSFTSFSFCFHNVIDSLQVEYFTLSVVVKVFQKLLTIAIK